MIGAAHKYTLTASVTVTASCMREAVARAAECLVAHRDAAAHGGSVTMFRCPDDRADCDTVTHVTVSGDNFALNCSLASHSAV